MIVDDEVRWIAQRAADGKDFAGSLLELANEAKRYQCLRKFSWFMLKEVDAFCLLEDMAFDSMIDRIRAMWPTHYWHEAWPQIQEQVRDEIRSGSCVGHRGMGYTKKESEKKHD